MSRCEWSDIVTFSPQTGVICWGVTEFEHKWARGDTQSTVWEHFDIVMQTVRLAVCSLCPESRVTQCKEWR